MNDDETDSADEEDTSILAKVDTTIVHTNLDIPEMAALIHQVCAERKQPDRELTVVHYVAVDQVNDLDNLCNAIELSNLKLPCRHTLVQCVGENVAGKQYIKVKCHAAIFVPRGQERRCNLRAR